MQGLASRLRRVEPTGDDAGVGASDGDPRAPLWRGAQWFRALSVVYAVGRQIDEADRYQRIGWSWVMIGAVVAVSVIAGLGYVRGFGRNRWFVIGEFAAAAVLALGTVWVASPEFTAHNQALPTTLWLTNPVVSAAILGGPVAGMAGGIAIAVASSEEKAAFCLRHGADQHARPCSLMLLDLGLPDIDGVEVLRRTRRTSRVPVVVLSARRASDDKVEFAIGQCTHQS